MRNLCLALLAAALGCGAAAGAAQTGEAEPWRTKPFQQWGEKEAERILTESPWAQTVGGGAAGAVSVERNVLNIHGRPWTVRLRSALPIRQAILRLRQLREKYETMGEAKRAKFDEQNRPLMECEPCADHYVISLVPPSGGRVGTPSSLNSMPLAKLKLFSRLTNEKGEQRELVHFTPAKSPGQEVVFFFARRDAQGRALLDASSRKLVFALDPEVLGTSTASRFTFDVTKMILGGEVAF